MRRKSLLLLSLKSLNLRLQLERWLFNNWKSLNVSVKKRKKNYAVRRRKTGTRRKWSAVWLRRLPKRRLLRKLSSSLLRQNNERFKERQINTGVCTPKKSYPIQMTWKCKICRAKASIPHSEKQEAVSYEWKIAQLWSLTRSQSRRIAMAALPNIPVWFTLTKRTPTSNFVCPGYQTRHQTFTKTLFIVSSVRRKRRSNWASEKVREEKQQPWPSFLRV